MRLFCLRSAPRAFTADRLHATAQAACQTRRPARSQRLRFPGRAQAGQARAQDGAAPAEPAPAELNLFDPREATSQVIAPQAKNELEAPQPAPRRDAPQARPRKPRGTGPAKLFVLDTNVLMHDPM